jgi:hypothetical protein
MLFALSSQSLFIDVVLLLSQDNHLGVKLFPCPMILFFMTKWRHIEPLNLTMSM